MNRTMLAVTSSVFALWGGVAWGQDTQPMDAPPTVVVVPVPENAAVVVVPAVPVETQNAVPAPGEAPAPIEIQTYVDLTGEPGPPADPAAARKEAVNAWQWARDEGCRDDPMPRQCLRDAKAEHDRVMAGLGASR